MQEHKIAISSQIGGLGNWYWAAPSPRYTVNENLSVV